MAANDSPHSIHSRIGPTGSMFGQGAKLTPKKKVPNRKAQLAAIIEALEFGEVLLLSKNRTGKAIWTWDSGRRVSQAACDQLKKEGRLKSDDGLNLPLVEGQTWRLVSGE